MTAPPPVRRQPRRLPLLIALLFIAGVALGAIVVAVAGSSSTTRSTTRSSVGDSERQADKRTNGRSSPTVAPTESATARTDLPANVQSSFASFAHTMPGHIEMAVLPVATVEPTLLGSENDIAHGWSTTKIPVIATLINQLSTEAQKLTAAEEQEVRAAITESSNEAILALFRVLEERSGGLAAASRAVEEELERAQGEPTVVATAPPPPGASTTFGQTDWQPRQAVRFFAALDRDCVLSPAETRKVLGLMQAIEPSEAWGVGREGADFPHVAFKGGWGPESNGAYLVRQSGIIDPGSREAVAVSIVAYPPPGASSFLIGQEMVTKAAAWLKGELTPSIRRVPYCVEG